LGHCSGKASGADGITAECFKAFVEDGGEVAAYALAPVLTKLLNLVFIHGDYPTHFKVVTFKETFP
jgi:hypothetical protein